MNVRGSSAARNLDFAGCLVDDTLLGPLYWDRGRLARIDASVDTFEPIVRAAPHCGRDARGPSTNVMNLQ